MDSISCNAGEPLVDELDGSGNWRRRAGNCLCCFSCCCSCYCASFGSLSISDEDHQLSLPAECCFDSCASMSFPTYRNCVFGAAWPPVTSAHCEDSSSPPCLRHTARMHSRAQYIGTEQDRSERFLCSVRRATWIETHGTTTTREELAVRLDILFHSKGLTDCRRCNFPASGHHYPSCTVWIAPFLLQVQVVPTQDMLIPFVVPLRHPRPWARSPDDGLPGTSELDWNQCEPMKHRAIPVSILLTRLPHACSVPLIWASPPGYCVLDGTK